MRPIRYWLIALLPFLLAGGWFVLPVSRQPTIPSRPRPGRTRPGRGPALVARERLSDLTFRRPGDGEALYQLGLCEEARERHRRASGLGARRAWEPVLDPGGRQRRAIPDRSRPPRRGRGSARAAPPRRPRRAPTAPGSRAALPLRRAPGRRPPPDRRVVARRGRSVRRSPSALPAGSLGLPPRRWSTACSAGATQTTIGWRSPARTSRPSAAVPTRPRDGSTPAWSAGPTTPPRGRRHSTRRSPRTTRPRPSARRGTCRLAGDGAGPPPPPRLARGPRPATACSRRGSPAGLRRRGARARSPPGTGSPSSPWRGATPTRRGGSAAARPRSIPSRARYKALIDRDDRAASAGELARLAALLGRKDEARGWSLIRDGVAGREPLVAPEVGSTELPLAMGSPT